ncbi:MAG: serine/threonine protein kinase [Clostridia bacterium]|nr:serine/threonine protein kinase [Clostridia bacterium]
MITQTIDGISFRLKAPFDFTFLHEYGRIFRIWDDQDSGNICFAAEYNGERTFIKFAGASTARGCDTPTEAVARLKAALPVYQSLRHPALAEFLGAREIGGGFAMLFRYADAACMGRMYPESRSRFLALPIEARLRVYSDILDFLAYTAASGWLAVDFYDGSVMYDFARNQTVLCDIDFFRPLPTHNDMGRMWGSSRFMSPEESILGSPLDERTNVYTAGAMAFALFADSARSIDAWPLSPAAYAVITRATSHSPESRQPSLRHLIHEWHAALCPEYSQEGQG